MDLITNFIPGIERGGGGGGLPKKNAMKQIFKI